MVEVKELESVYLIYEIKGIRVCRELLWVVEDKFMREEEGVYFYYLLLFCVVWIWGFYFEELMIMDENFFLLGYVLGVG